VHLRKAMFDSTDMYLGLIAFNEIGGLQAKSFDVHHRQGMRTVSASPYNPAEQGSRRL
jgi:hypothetical protein